MKFIKYGLTAAGLTAHSILDALEKIDKLGDSRVLHVCFDNTKKQFTKK